VVSPVALRKVVKMNKRTGLLARIVVGNAFEAATSSGAGGHASRMFAPPPKRFRAMREWGR
jgi:hypothetical protein